MIRADEQRRRRFAAAVAVRARAAPAPSMRQPNAEAHARAATDRNPDRAEQPPDRALHARARGARRQQTRRRERRRRLAAALARSDRTASPTVFDPVDVLVGDLDVELVLERQHDVDEPRGVHLEILEDVGVEPDAARAPPGSSRAG